MYATMTSASDATSLQKDLDRLAAWEKKWQMEFHPQKCSVLRITRNKSTKIFQYRLHGHILEPETNSKYLGVTINNKLSWTKHIDNITKKANGSIAFLRRNLQISQKHIKTKAYTTLVRPQIEYAAAIWDPHYKITVQRVKMVQRRAARYVCNDYGQQSSVTASDASAVGMAQSCTKESRYQVDIFLQVHSWYGCSRHHQQSETPDQRNPSQPSPVLHTFH